MVTQITTHNADARARLLQQYKGKVKIEGLLDALGSDQIQDLEDAIFGLNTRLDIDSSSGIQLDNIGEIVGRARSGQSDTIYRLFLKATIGRNVSESEAERVISVWKIITQGTIIQLLEAFPAEVALYSDVELDVSLVDIAFALMQDVVGAGIRVTPTAVLVEDGFGFDGNPDALGFGSSISQGSATSTSAFKLIDTLATFQTDLVDNTMLAMNDTDGTQSTIVSVDSEIQLTLTSDIFTSGEEYYINENVGGRFSYIQGS